MKILIIFSNELNNNFSLIIAFKYLFGYLYKSICFIHIYDYNNKFSIKFTMKKSSLIILNLGLIIKKWN